MYQISLFDGQHKFENDKPIRLIELFGGYGSQALALKYLGIPFEHWRLSEWAVKSIQAYKDMHFADDNTDYSAGLTERQVYEKLFAYSISADYNEPMTLKQIAHLKEKRARRVYNNMQATHNLGSITQIKTEDLSIVDTDKYCYVMTYSYPCQDVSNAGKQAGMTKDSGTRSALLWEVERLLNEMPEKPQILIMENVPQVHSKGNREDFNAWCQELEKMGYHNYWQDMNAKDQCIPQNRNRCFMVSLLGDYYFTFPKPQKLTVRLKDFLDKKVDEKYYLSDKTVEMFIEQHKFTEDTTVYANYKRIDKVDTEVAKTLCARDYKGFGTGFDTMNAVVEKAHGVMLGTSEQFNAGLCDEMSRSITTEGKNGVVEWGADGVLLNKTPAFQRGALTDLSRTLDCNGKNGVIEWNKN